MSGVTGAFPDKYTYRFVVRVEGHTHTALSLASTFIFCFTMPTCLFLLMEASMYVCMQSGVHNAKAEECTTLYTCQNRVGGLHGNQFAKNRLGIE